MCRKYLENIGSRYGQYGPSANTPDISPEKKKKVERKMKTKNYVNIKGNVTYNVKYFTL